MRSPSKLRYVECELPSAVEKTIAEFEDDFDLRLQPFFDQLKDIELNVVPELNTILDEQIAIREQLVEGSQVQSLASLAAIDESIMLTSPKRDNNDPETIRIDERKLGAAGICMLDGRIFKIIDGNRLDALRYLWEAAGGSYELFVTYGTMVFSSPEGGYTLFEYNKKLKDVMPFIDKGFTDLESLGYKNSQYKHRLIWNTSISASYALKTRMATLGYDSDQINDMFAGKDTNASYDFIASINTINMLVQAVTRLMFIPRSDRLRQPPWAHETDYMIMAIETFLEYRTRLNSTSALFDSLFWQTALEELRPQDFKELLEHRLEILNIELPQEIESLTLLLERATSLPAGTAMINTYMLDLPVGDTEETALADSLFDFGLNIWKKLEPKSPKADQLEALLLELSGDVGPLTLNTPTKKPSVFIDPEDLSSLFPSANLPSQGALVDAVTATGDADKDLLNSCLALNSKAKKFTQKVKIRLKKRQKTNKGEEASSPEGTTQGLPSSETFAMLLLRKMKPPANMGDCSGSKDIKNDIPPVYEEKKVLINEGKLSPEWKQFSIDYNYLRAKLKISDDAADTIRKAVQVYLAASVASGVINPADVGIAASLAVVNNSPDSKAVAKDGAKLVKLADGKAQKNYSGKVTSGVTTDESKKGKFIGDKAAAKNRRQLASQGGKKTSPGLTAKETEKVAAALRKGTNSGLPFLLGSTIGPEAALLTQAGANALVQGLKTVDPSQEISFKRSTTRTFELCPPKWARLMNYYLSNGLENGRRQLEAWLVKMINIMKHQLINFQDKIDAFILAVQGVMDGILAKLERLLTLDLNFHGKLGFENSLFKCSWALDLGLKINLLDWLLLKIDLVMPKLMAGVLKMLGLIMEFLAQVFCIPIRWIEEMLGKASKLLGAVGCTVKDVKLPVEIFELLKLIQGTFNLRGLVLRKGSKDWLNAMAGFNMGRNEWSGLSQFAAICANKSAAAAIDAIKDEAKLMASDLPLAGKKDTKGKAISAMTGVTP